MVRHAVTCLHALIPARLFPLTRLVLRCGCVNTALLVDEASMLDVQLAAALLQVSLHAWTPRHAASASFSMWL